MKMNEYLQLTLVFLAGLMLGGVFFGGLWWTVQKGFASPRPALWFLGSLLVRTGVVLGGFYVFGAGDWQRFSSCLLGFMLARFFVSKFLNRQFQPPQALKTGASHAP
jgi:F1F0 ATPase subunit 2